MGGLFKKMPVTSSTCSIAALSISGVPPFNGFWSKLIIIIALVQANYYAVAAITVAVSFLTLVSFIKVQRYSIFGQLPDALRQVKESPVLMSTALIVFALLCIGSGLLYPLFGESVLEIARQTVLNKNEYIQTVMNMVAHSK
jgi:multicomponent Na+:H+ antiporter subunit D